MTEGRLFRSAAASGPLAESAEVALQRTATDRVNATGESAQESSAAASPVHTEAAMTHTDSKGGQLHQVSVSTPEPEPAGTSSVIPSVVPPIVDAAEDFEHLFAAEQSPETVAESTADTPASAPDEAGADDPLNAFDHLFSADERNDGSSPAAAELGLITQTPTAQTQQPRPPSAAAQLAPQDDSPNATDSSETPHKPLAGLAALRAMSSASGTASARAAASFRVPFRGVVTLIIGVTLIVGTLEALIGHRIGLATGIVSVLVTLACSFRANPADRSAAIFALPTAWLLCALLPGQLVAPNSGSWIFRQLLLVLQVLGDNAWWIIIGTVAAAGIHVRARFAAAGDQSHWR